MERSPYLAQALQAMSAPPPASPAGPDLAAMQRMAQQRGAWEAANPGQNYLKHQIGQIGQGVMQAPGRIMAAPGNVGRALGGLFGLGQAAGGR